MGHDTTTEEKADDENIGDYRVGNSADIGKLVDSYLRSIEATEFEQRLARLEKGKDNEKFSSLWAQQG
jgi:hypothetical protein